MYVETQRHEDVAVVLAVIPRRPELSSLRSPLSGGSCAAIPLERSAYELDAQFAAAHSTEFSVSAHVQAWRTAGRF